MQATRKLQPQNARNNYFYCCAAGGRSWQRKWCPIGHKNKNTKKSELAGKGQRAKDVNPSLPPSLALEDDECLCALSVSSCSWSLSVPRHARESNNP